MHYYQFNIGDYASHTGYLSLLEDLAYRRLLDAYYLSETPFPDDAKQVARIIGMRDNSDEVTQVLQDFFTLKDGFWYHKRVDEELELYHQKAVTARNNGKKGGRPKKANKPNPNPEETQSVILANPEETGLKANHKPITNNQEPVKKNTSKYFDDFWKAYPKKVDKKKTLIIWKRRNMDDITEMILTDVQNRIEKDSKWIDGFIPNPTTYLNGDRWEDELQQRGQSIEKNRGIQRFDADTYIIGQIEAEYE